MELGLNISAVPFAVTGGDMFAAGGAGQGEAAVASEIHRFRRMRLGAVYKYVGLRIAFCGGREKLDRILG
jgi:hypothetical protein